MNTLADLFRWNKPAAEQIRCHTGLGVDATNPVSHLVYTSECESMRITFASVDRPSVSCSSTCKGGLHLYGVPKIQG